MSSRALPFPAALLLFLVLESGVGAQVETRDPLPMPDIPGHRTLKGDFHIHTVFSDGNVWPTTRVLEAWRDGLDVIALTDHVEYRPHVKDVTTGIGRSYAIAKPLADEIGVILIPGVEITRPASPAVPDGATAHFNALFITDAEAFDVPTLTEALERARAQKAFVFWNHPAFRVAKAEWFPAIAEAHDRKLFQGMELVNGPDFYPEAFPWIAEKRLTILSNSDAHQPMPPRERAGIRPITLIFAKTADAEGVREAFVAGRTAAWMGSTLRGPEEQLRAFWTAAVRFETARVRPGTFALLRARNLSALPFRFVARGAPDWLRLEPASVAAEGESLLRARIMPGAPAGEATADIELELTNVHPGPDRNLVVRVPLKVHVIP